MVGDMMKEHIKAYLKNQPELEKIMKQLDIDEESYLNALNELYEGPVNVQPLTNSTYPI